MLFASVSLHAHGSLVLFFFDFEGAVYGDLLLLQSFIIFIFNLFTFPLCFSETG